MDTTVLGIHVLLAAIIVGPQFLLFLAVVPSTWLIEDERLRRNVTRVVTQRFGVLFGVGLVGLILSGIYLWSTDIFVPPEIRTDMTAYRFGIVFIVKMLLIVTLVVLTAVHGAVFGRRIGRISEAVERGEAEPAALDAARRSSLTFSVLLLLVSVAIVFAGVTLSNHAYSHLPA